MGNRASGVKGGRKKEKSDGRIRRADYSSATPQSGPLDGPSENASAGTRSRQGSEAPAHISPAAGETPKGGKKVTFNETDIDVLLLSISEMERMQNTGQEYTPQHPPPPSIQSAEEGQPAAPVNMAPLVHLERHQLSRLGNSYHPSAKQARAHLPASYVSSYASPLPQGRAGYLGAPLKPRDSTHPGVPEGLTASNNFGSVVRTGPYDQARDSSPRSYSSPRAGQAYSLSTPSPPPVRTPSPAQRPSPAPGPGVVREYEAGPLRGPIGMRQQHASTPSPHAHSPHRFSPAALSDAPPSHTPYAAANTASSGTLADYTRRNSAPSLGRQPQHRLKGSNSMMNFARKLMEPRAAGAQPKGAVPPSSTVCTL